MSVSPIKRIGDLTRELSAVKVERDKLVARVEVLTTQRNDLVVLCERLKEEYAELSEKLHDEI